MSALGRTLALGLSLLALAWPAHAQAPEPARRRVGVRFVEGTPQLDVSVADFLSDEETARKLTSGLPQTILLRAYAYTTAQAEPIAITARSCRVAYDLWEERFRVQITTESSERVVSAASLDEVAAACLVARHLPIGRAEDWSPRRGARAYFAVLVELNPLTPDTLARIRRWLARPSRGAIETESFFGSFVSLFVNRGVGDAERVLRFRSQELDVP